MAWNSISQQEKITTIDSTGKTVTQNVSVIATKELGKGTYSEVIKLQIANKQKKWGKKVIVKKVVILTEDPEDIISIDSEKDALKLTGQLYGTQQDNDKCVFFMPYLGKNLKHVTIKEQTKKSFNADDMINIMGDVIYDLAKLHKAGFIHSDIKLENMSYSRRTQKAGLLDFGFCRPVGQGERQGTFHIMAPEVIFEEQNQTQAADIYSLGISFLAFLELTLEEPEGTFITLMPLEGNDPTVEVRWWMVNPDIAANLKTILENQLKMVPDNAQTCANLLISMVNKNPKDRPSAEEVLEIYQTIFVSSQVTKQVMELENEVKDYEQSVTAMTQMLTAKRDRLEKNPPGSLEIKPIEELLNGKDEKQGKTTPPLETFNGLKEYIEVTHSRAKKGGQDTWQKHKQLHIYKKLKTNIMTSLKIIQTEKIKPLKIETIQNRSFFEWISDFIQAILSPFKPVNNHDDYSTATSLTNIDNEITQQVKKMRP